MTRSLYQQILFRYSPEKLIIDCCSWFGRRILLATLCLTERKRQGLSSGFKLSSFVRQSKERLNIATRWQIKLFHLGGPELPSIAFQKATGPRCNSLTRGTDWKELPFPLLSELKFPSSRWFDHLFQWLAIWLAKPTSAILPSLLSTFSLAYSALLSR